MVFDKAVIEDGQLAVVKDVVQIVGTVRVEQVNGHLGRDGEQFGQIGRPPTVNHNHGFYLPPSPIIISDCGVVALPKGMHVPGCVPG